MMVADSITERPAQSVRKPPGSTIVTLIPSGLTSFARTSEIASTANLVVLIAPLIIELGQYRVAASVTTTFESFRCWHTGDDLHGSNQSY